MSVQAATQQLDAALGLVTAAMSDPGPAAGPRATAAIPALNAAADEFEASFTDPTMLADVSREIAKLRDDCRARAAELVGAAVTPWPFVYAPLGAILNAIRNMDVEAHWLLMQMTSPFPFPFPFPAFPGARSLAASGAPPPTSTPGTAALRSMRNPAAERLLAPPPPPDRWQLANVKEAQAFYSRGHLLLVVRGTKPTPRYVVVLERSLLDVEPPAFVARWHGDGIGPDVMTDYELRQVFFIGAYRETVVVKRAAGADLVVPVKARIGLDLVSLGSGNAAPLADVAEDKKKKLLDGALSTTEAQKPTPFREAVGYSDAMSFDEAFADAVARLAATPSQQPPVADEMTTVEVVATGGIFGGIAGLRRLFVKVRG
jgi:hypothetical protein